jgi:hypothetical protein
MLKLEKPKHIDDFYATEWGLQQSFKCSTNAEGT